MTPIQTIYKGWRLRSRTEARWAVFFDALGIRWEYEPEGFQFADGTRYLPDFWLPGFNRLGFNRLGPGVDDAQRGCFVEVKGGDCRVPEFVCRDIWEPPQQPSYAMDPGDFRKAWMLATEGRQQVLCVWGAPRAENFILFRGDSTEVRFDGKYLPGGRNADEYRLFLDPQGIKFFDEVVDRAVCAARSARFEFGQSGATV
jgi:hypothetical protein